MNDEHCHACGQRITGYRSAVSRGVADTLKKIYAFVLEKGLNVVHIEKELVQAGRITGNAGGNAQGHMVRLGLLAHIENEPGNYAITTKGVEFLNGTPIPKWVRVAKATKDKGSHIVEHAEETCTIRDFDRKGEYWEIPGFEIKEGRIIQAPILEL